MNTKIDLKSALCGLAVGILVMLATGAAFPSSPMRYQIAGAANYFMVVDTTTGQVWGGNFNQLGTGSAALEFRNCPQSSGDFFQPKVEK
jgi:hypothetical protein